MRLRALLKTQSSTENDSPESINFQREEIQREDSIFGKSFIFLFMIIAISFSSSSVDSDRVKIGGFLPIIGNNREIAIFD